MKIGNLKMQRPARDEGVSDRGIMRKMWKCAGMEMQWSVRDEKNRILNAGVG